MHPRRHALDQRELPGPSLELPRSEGKARQPRGERQREQDRARGAAAYGVRAAVPVGIDGIMFVLRWNMIHSEPPMVISTSTAVKT